MLEIFLIIIALVGICKLGEQHAARQPGWSQPHAETSAYGCGALVITIVLVMLALLVAGIVASGAG